MTIFYRSHRYLLLLTWILVVIVVGIKYGVITIGDSQQYLLRAENLLKGQITGFRYFWYIGYIGFLTMTSLLPGNTLVWAIVVQIIISGIAVIYLYKSTLILSNNWRAAFLASFLFIAWPKVQVWNFYIMTESLFISLMIFLMYAIIRKNTYAIILFCFFILLTRPTGTIVIFATLLSIIFIKPTKKVKSGTLLIIGCIGCILVGLLANKILANYDLINQYHSGKIVFSADQVKNKELSKGLFIFPENDLIIPTSSNSGLTDAFIFFKNNFNYAFKLISTKILWFIWDYRPYYSTGHIMANVSLLLIAYLFSFYFLVIKDHFSRIKIWGTTILVSLTLMSGLTYLTWEGRFFAPVYPLVFVFMACGINHFWYKARHQG